ncbi:hypothetical protein ASE23_01995 [Rhizobium sp. Root73]|uniref:hypothetical protein n=1 Tax=unclassified Rhizobium TaxID=2613769 RepID=UPI000725809A|nr:MULTISPECIES: hypothetical protein [unclassified Rhizobium]KQY17453.1 hypothetical protein ASD36_01995 [Rhizobium sp. Root1334]KRC13333.1 hypothetical protein ASE23_01995 [Rhizobium sp. Root73]
MNLTTFFAYARRAPFGGRLTQAQIDGMTAILDEWDKRKLLDNRWLAYMLATAFHETGGRMQALRENMNYTSAAQIKKTWPTRFPSIASAQPFVRNGRALANKVYGGRMGNTGADDGWVYRGDGLPQLTGKENFQKFNVQPGMNLATAVRVMFDGMIKGLFTGEKLSDHFGQIANDPVAARRIVNRLDKAKLIADYFKSFMDAIEAAREVLPPVDVTSADAKADDKPAGQSGTAITTVLVPAATGLAVPIVTGINNVYALIFAVALLAVSSLAAFMFLSGRWSINRGKAT